MSDSASGGEPTTAAPRLVTTDPVSTAVVRGIVRTAELPDFFDSSFGTLSEVLATQGVAIVGPAFALYRRPPSSEATDLEVGFATDRPVRGDGTVVASSLPGGRTARVTHAGAFEGLVDSWRRLRSWLEEQDLTPGSTMWEVYVTEPSPEMDPRDLRTELNWPLAD
ncbi:GyrI-like domain-containing protein [Saccharomonospora iraqiensis]|uniref:GyrI-like domain-containing protein n=1 Tax=Saccharomonospora iraqiensis TaxID=52698 RepID=UPI00040CA83E|nr:GyrI-like domain-containing protein [Saccharomonospora iraqiensis]